MSDASTLLDRVLVLEMVRVTEAAAIAASTLTGRGDEKAADAAAVEAMRAALNELDIDGTVVIGEGERDEAPMLFIGEKVGSGNGPAIDIALDQGVPVLNFSFHSPSLRPGNTPYVRTAADLDRFYRWWDAVLDHLGRRGVVPTDTAGLLMLAAAKRPA